MTVDRIQNYSSSDTAILTPGPSSGDRTGLGEPDHRLAGDLGYPVKVPVMVQQRQSVQLDCGSDEAPMARTFTAAVHQEEDWYVAHCLELDVASQGESLDAALANLREAVEVYLEEMAQPVVDFPLRSDQRHHRMNQSATTAGGILPLICPARRAEAAPSTPR